MSFADRNEKAEQVIESKSSDSEENYETEEETASEESFSEPSHQCRNIAVDSDHMKPSRKKNRIKENQSRRQTVSLRHRKCSRLMGAKVKPGKVSKKRKSEKTSEKNKNVWETHAEISKKGKRCRLGGKSKGKPTEQSDQEKYESDEDSDIFYCGRISLGYFQKIKDQSGASTSYECPEDDRIMHLLQNEEKADVNISEEMQLLELQNWGNAEFYLSYSGNTEDISVKGIKPDKL